MTRQILAIVSSSCDQLELKNKLILKYGPCDCVFELDSSLSLDQWALPILHYNVVYLSSALLQFNYLQLFFSSLKSNGTLICASSDSELELQLQLAGFSNVMLVDDQVIVK